MSVVTAYELLGDDKTYRWNENIFLNRGVMYYLDDDEVADTWALYIAETAQAIRDRKRRGKK